MNAKTISLLLLLALTATSTPFAKDKGGKGGGNGKSAGPNFGASEKGPAVHVHTPSKPDAHVNVTFGSPEKQIITAYVANGKKAKGLPPGLAKKVANGGDLPPGWQKKCVRGEILPEIVFKHSHPLPPDLLIKLPAPPQGTVLVAVDGKVLHVDKSTRHIHAVIDLD
jgi:hypothetical protein